MTLYPEYNISFKEEFMKQEDKTNNNNNTKTAFTLAEVLITPGVIGVVSAMTLPTVIKNYQKKASIRVKSAYSQLLQAI